MDYTVDQLKARISELESQLRAAKPIECVPTIEPDALYMIDEVKVRLRCEKTTVYDLIRTGQLAHVNIGAGKKGRRVWGRDITAFLDSRREGGPAPAMKLKYVRA